MTKIHLVCANCGAINRIPQERLSMSPQCGKCQKALFAATVLQLGETSFDRYVNTEEHGQLAARFNIRSIPTLILFHQGKELRRQSGAMNREQIVHWAQGHG
jgi:thioredoxin 2